MKKKGFTLIELLAVIVVLAIIALIATPLVMNTIKNVRKGSAERSAQAYVNRVETMVMEERTKGTVVADGLYLVNEEGNLCKEADTVECTDPYLVEIKGDKPALESKIAIENGRVVAKLISNQLSKTVIRTNDGYRIKHNDKNILVVTNKYDNGEEVYYDVNTGKSCNSYHKDNSKTGYNGIFEGENNRKTTNNQNGCMKFYAFNDDEDSSTVNLLLDHNTTAKIAWKESGTYYTPDNKFKERLANDTTGWVAEQPSVYTDPAKNYTIRYSTNARLITANEVAQITGNTSWDSATPSASFYFDGNNTCKYQKTSKCKYGWLYDRTGQDCKDYGCLNDSNISTSGYWTASANTMGNTYIWIVYKSSRILSSNVKGCPLLSSGVDCAVYGIRPVIEVLKSNL